MSTECQVTECQLNVNYYLHFYALFENIYHKNKASLKKIISY